MIERACRLCALVLLPWGLRAGCLLIAEIARRCWGAGAAPDDAPLVQEQIDRRRVLQTHYFT